MQYNQNINYYEISGLLGHLEASNVGNEQKPYLYNPLAQIMMHAAESLVNMGVLRKDDT